MLLGLKEEGLIDTPDDFIRVGAAFGGGVGLSKNLCGCISGAAIGAGFKFGSLDPTGTAPRQAYARTKAIINAFQAQFGSLQCRDLTSPWSDFADRNRVYRCSEFVHFVVEQMKQVLTAPTESGEWEEAWWNDYLTRRDKVR